MKTTEEKRIITVEEVNKAIDLLVAYASQNEGTCGLLVSLKDRDTIAYCCHGTQLDILTSLVGYATVYPKAAEIVNAAAEILRK